MVSVITFPLLYYSIIINSYVNQANVEGAVSLKDFWMVVVGGIVYQSFRYSAIVITRPIHAKLCKEKKDMVKRERYIERSTEGTAKACFHTSAFIWGWIVLREVGWLPWCIGGQGSLDVVIERNFQS